MKKISGNRKFSRTRIGIVTNKMSEKVYAHLEFKAQQNELSKYIIELVERDLEKDAQTAAFTLAKNELQEISKVAKKLKSHLEKLTD